MEDREIVDLYWQRSDRAISESAHKFGGYCYTIAYQICANAEDADECVNDTWFRAWNLMPDKRPSILSAFLGRITRNYALDCYRARTSQKRGGGETALALDELYDCVPASASAEKRFEQKLLEEAIRDFVAALPETERKVFVARYWFLAPIAAIANRTGFTPGKIKSMLHRTRGKLRVYLEEEDLC